MEKIAPRVLIFSLWLSTLIFGIFILKFYLGHFFRSDYLQLNFYLPELFSLHSKFPNFMILLHFIGGGDYLHFRLYSDD